MQPSCRLFCFLIRLVVSLIVVRSSLEQKDLSVTFLFRGRCCTIWCFFGSIQILSQTRKKLPYNIAVYNRCTLTCWDRERELGGMAWHVVVTPNKKILQNRILSIMKYLNLAHIFVKIVTVRTRLRSNQALIVCCANHLKNRRVYQWLFDCQKFCRLWH